MVAAEVVLSILSGLAVEAIVVLLGFVIKNEKTKAIVLVVGTLAATIVFIFMMQGQAPTSSTSITMTPTATFTPSATQALTLTLTPGDTPSRTPTTGLACNVAEMVVNALNGAKIVAGQASEKIVSIRNIGSCPWNTQYLLERVSGEPNNLPASVRLPSDVPPETTVEISLKFVAPLTAGKYTSGWKLRNASGELFGTRSNDSFSVTIDVISPTPTVKVNTPTPRPSSTPIPPVYVEPTSGSQEQTGSQQPTGPQQPTSAPVVTAVNNP